jgi:lipoprotein-anchoring transpeptidase ErfK/SrfK
VATDQQDSTRRRRLTGLAVGTALACTALPGLSACSGGGSDAGAVSLSPAQGAQVDPSSPVVVSAPDGGHLSDVTVTDGDGARLPGALAADDLSWRSTEPLGAGRKYSVQVITDGGSDGYSSTVRTFTTKSASNLLSAELGPSDGAVYGVGEPITATLSAPVPDPAARKQVESALTVKSNPSVTGGWYWVDDKTLHFRPQGYWPAHTAVSVSFDMHGRRIGGPSSHLYAGPPSHIAFRTGEKVVAVTDVASDYMTVYRNGNEVRSVPVTTGKAGFRTRGGIKVVLEQAPTVYMNSNTVGIAAGSTNAYHMNVYWDTRVTWSGEYVHAAPWSVGHQGVSNVSHGCTGLSTGDARWFYETVRKGDIVQVVHAEGAQMEPFGNGFGDWNLGWGAWQRGSAVGHPVVTRTDVAGGGATAQQVGYLRPEAS